MADIFISYARSDRDRIAALSAALERAGYGVWWDRHIDGGAAFAQAIEAELDASKAVVVAWSMAALKSDWVKDEAAAARDQGKLVPVSLDGAVAPLGFRQYHVIDLSAWDGDAATPVPEDLLRSLESRVCGTPSRPRPATDDGTALSSGASHARPAARGTHGRMVAGLGLAVLVVATALAYRWHAGRDAADPATASNAGPTSAPAAQSLDKSIAVLPFENRSAKADDAYFAEGMHDDLLTQLAQVGDLRVVSRTTVMRYADTDKPIPEIARELGVGVVLEGAVQRAGSRVRINVQLIDGRTDKHLWAESFDRELTVANLFDIQSEITRAIATALESVLDGPAAPSVAGLPTQNTEAYDAYLLGNSLSRYDQVRPEQVRRAAAAYARATALDPGFAAAYARQAGAYLTLVWWGVDMEENTRLAREALERARALAPGSSETRYAEANYRYWVEHDYAGADALLRAALEQSPKDVRLWTLHGATSRRAGDFAASTAAFERALALDPKDPWPAGNLAYNAGYQGQLAEARRWLSRAWALSPDSGYNTGLDAWLALASGGTELAWRRYEALRAQPGLDPVLIDYLFAPLATTLRDPARLEVLANRLATQDERDEQYQQHAFWRAVALDRLGRHAEARELARSVQRRLAEEPQDGGDPQGSRRTWTALVDAFLGASGTARAAAASLAKDPPRDQLWLVESAPNLMSAYARLDEPDAAFDLAERAMDRFSPIHFVYVKDDVAFDPYRDRPRYRELAARYEAWKAAQPPAD